MWTNILLSRLTYTLLVYCQIPSLICSDRTEKQIDTIPHFTSKEMEAEGYKWIWPASRQKSQEAKRQDSKPHAASTVSYVYLDQLY
jgi:hypothetical protein